VEALKYIDPRQSSALLRYSRANASAGADSLTAQGVEHVFVPHPPLMDVTTNTAWLYLAIAKYFIVERYSVYDLIAEIPAEGDAAKKRIKTIKSLLNHIEETMERDALNDFANRVGALAEELGYATRAEHIRKLLTTIQDKSYHAAFHAEDFQHVAITFHSAKGLEFDQVILFGEDYADFSKPDTIFNHYVSATRAKTKLIIIDTNSGYARRFKTGLIDTFAQSSLRLDDVISFVWR
jgi:superfamily I DNA/RNA helicase